MQFGNLIIMKNVSFQFQLLFFEFAQKNFQKFRTIDAIFTFSSNIHTVSGEMQTEPKYLHVLCAFFSSFFLNYKNAIKLQMG